MGRPYDTPTWRRFRALQLRQSPVCVLCLDRGIITPATDVDHIVPIKEGGEFLDFANVRSLCHEDHSRVTRAAQYGHEVVIKGCDARGYPLDPKHWWNRE